MPPRRKKPDATQQLLLTDAPLLEASVNAYWSVSEVLDWVKIALNDHPITGKTLTVRGELSNLRPASSGHVYATLKDDNASLGVVMWRSTAQKLPFRLEDGMAVLATGQFNVYAPGGSISLVIQQLVPDGIGALQLAFEQLKTQLSEEGHFEDSRKRSLPAFPLRIGIVTSATGAVIHDMWRVIRQKNPLVTAVLAAVAVQGEGAADQIAKAIQQLNHPGLQLDAIIVARGGGSFEDLFCFSQAVVVRAITASRLPVITGIGHQPDFSLADAATDYSAATPTAAADALVPDALGWSQWIIEREVLLCREISQRLITENQRLDGLTDRLVAGFQQLNAAMTYRLNSVSQGLVDGAQRQHQLAEQQLAQQTQALHQLSPLTTLARGYGVIETPDRQVITSIKQVVVGQAVQITLADGHLGATVTTLA